MVQAWFVANPVDREFKISGGLANGLGYSLEFDLTGLSAKEVSLRLTTPADPTSFLTTNGASHMMTSCSAKIQARSATQFPEPRYQLFQTYIHKGYSYAITGISFDPAALTYSYVLVPLFPCWRIEAENCPCQHWDESQLLTGDFDPVFYSYADRQPLARPTIQV